MTKIFQIYKVVDLGTLILWFSAVEKTKLIATFTWSYDQHCFYKNTNSQTDATGSWESTAFFSYLHFEFYYMAFFTLATAY